MICVQVVFVYIHQLGILKKYYTCDPHREFTLKHVCLSLKIEKEVYLYKT